jgi:radical SAM protein with 4Fe4S-binding SPASM domain
MKSFARMLGDLLGRRSVRELSVEDQSARVPVHVVWELTLACNLKCRHCGSRAGERRSGELSTGESLRVVRELADLGTREISLIGGEAYIRRDWLEIIRAIRMHGMACSMQTGGYRLSAESIRAAKKAGLSGLGVSIDGLEDVHDRLRGVVGSFAETLRVLRQAQDLGLTTSVNTQITALSVPQLDRLLTTIAAAGATYWQVQFTVPMGNAADNWELLVQPYELATLMPTLAGLHAKARRMGVRLLPGNNIGYFGPHDELWRKSYRGCTAGLNVMGLEADGTLKGCPSLPTRRYAAGNVRDGPIRELWSRSPKLDLKRGDEARLWGFCATCRHGETCGGGCSWTADALFGRPGNNPYCHHRVLSLAAEGVRERLVRAEAASPEPFATGRFDIIREPVDGGISASDSIGVESALL